MSPSCRHELWNGTTQLKGSQRSSPCGDNEHVAVENQAGHLEDVMLRRLSKRRLIRLEADIRLLDKRLAEMVATNAAFAQLYELLTSMPGVGPVLAFTLIALLPELGLPPPRTAFPNRFVSRSLM